MYGDQHPEGTLDDDTLVFHLDVDSHAFSGRCQVCAIWILSTSPCTPCINQRQNKVNENKKDSNFSNSPQNSALLASLCLGVIE